MANGADSLRVEVSATESLSMKTVGTLYGVAVLAVGGRNGTGDGKIRSTQDGTYLSWKAPGSATWGAPVHAGADGTYLLLDGDDIDKYVRVQAYTDYLNPNPAESLVHIKDRYANGIGHDDVTAGEATAGDTTDYSVTIANDNYVGLSHVNFWLTPLSVANGLWISDDNATWVQPVYEADALSLGNIAGNADTTLYIRRVIAAGAASNIYVLNELVYTFEGI